MRDAPVQDQDPKGEGDASTSQSLPWGLLLLFVVLACLLSGVAAEVLRLPTLWGGGNRFLEYALPLPLTWGMLHWPSIGVFGVLLFGASSDPGRWPGLVRLACIGSLLGIAIACALVEALRGFPLLVYIGVDAAVALAVSALIATPQRTEVQGWSPRVRGAVLLGPALAVVIAVIATGLLQSRYKISRSDTRELSPKQDVMQWWAYSRRSAGDAADECPHLAALAATRRNQYARTDGERHRAILLFQDRDQMRRAGATDAWVTYEWWPDGREICSADPSFQPDR